MRYFSFCSDCSRRYGRKKRYFPQIWLCPFSLGFRWFPCLGTLYFSAAATVNMTVSRTLRFPIFLQLFILLYFPPCSQTLIQFLKYTQVLSYSRPFAHVFPLPKMHLHNQSLPLHETGISGYHIKNRIPESSLPYFSLLCV